MSDSDVWACYRSWQGYRASGFPTHCIWHVDDLHHCARGEGHEGCCRCRCGAVPGQCEELSPYTYEPPHFGMCTLPAGHLGKEHSTLVEIRRPDGRVETHRYQFTMVRGAS